MRRKLFLPGVLAATVAVAAACEGEPSTPPVTSGFTSAEARALATEYARLAGAVLSGGAFASPSASGEGAAVSATTRSIEIASTFECPKGGTLAIAGTHTTTVDAQSGTFSFHTAATRTDNACAVETEDGAVITFTGNPNVALTADWGLTKGTPGPRTATQKGSFTFARSTGETGTCTVDLTSTWNAATGSLTVKGTFCGDEVDVTETAG